MRISTKLYRYTEDVKSEVQQMRLSGSSWRSIEKATGIPRSTCRAWCEEEPMIPVQETLF